MFISLHREHFQNKVKSSQLLEFIEVLKVQMIDKLYDVHHLS